ncbi:MAG: hypothetical protein A2Z04_08770 [Chloroflexi bacterium RBG_16_57_9]|nr:MAG: hypothetical protein A2Z04_08770 [Chloroflexi bacterium RBG_16_57_9]
MEDADVVVAGRLRLLAEYVDELRNYREQAISFRVYLENKVLRRAVERTLQISAEACLDIGRQLIALEGFRYPQDNKDVFQVLREEGVIPKKLLPALIDMARFRNLVVHDYAKIDDAKVYTILKKNLRSFDTYAEAVVDYLTQSTEKPGEEPGSPDDE